MPTVTLWQRDSLLVTGSGGIAATDIPKLVQALGGSAQSEVLELLQASAESVVPNGVESWMKAHDIPVTDFWSWF